MKKNRNILTSIPAAMSDFKENGQLTYAKLKVFHLGRTSDNRVFTQEFADKLAKNIGGTPVVAFYDEEADDFYGHWDSQSVFGFVPEKPEIVFEKDDEGNSWLVTDIRLFTKRKDVGKVAKRIIGQNQSLELDPNTVKYNMLSDEEGNITEVEFVDGDLIGLSVLGSYDAPAFEGSGFFTSREELVEDELNSLINKYMLVSKGFSTDELEVFKTISEKNHVVVQEDGKLYIVYIDAAGKKRKEEIEVASMPVVPKDEDKDDEVGDGDGEDTGNGEDEGGEVEPEPEPEPEPELEAPEEGGEETVTETETGEGEADSEGVEFEAVKTSEEGETDVEEERMESETEQVKTNATSLDEKERQELESYRRAGKIAIIENYTEYLTQETINDYKNRVDEFGVDDLERELSFESMKSIRKTKNKLDPTFAFVPTSVNRGKKISDLNDEVANILKNNR